jgi:hypothetical protein
MNAWIERIETILCFPFLHKDKILKRGRRKFMFKKSSFLGEEKEVRPEAPEYRRSLFGSDREE